MLPNLIELFQKYVNKVKINFKFDNVAKSMFLKTSLSEESSNYKSKKLGCFVTLDSIVKKITFVIQVMSWTNACSSIAVYFSHCCTHPPSVVALSLGSLRKKETYLWRGRAHR